MTTRFKTIIRQSIGSHIYRRHQSNPCIILNQRQRRHQHTTTSCTFANQPGVFQVWGANTDVGKTIFSTCLLSCDSTNGPSLYLKPVHSGYTCLQNDAKFVSDYNTNKNINPITLFTYKDAVSPDLAARRSSSPIISDKQIIQSIRQVLNEFNKARTHNNSIGLIETSGGVCSPTPQGNLQVDTYRVLRLPGILVGDNTLGGISSTICAYEALRNRGYDIPIVVIFENCIGNLQNEISIQNHIDNNISKFPVAFSNTTVFQAPALPKLSSGNENEGSKVDDYLLQDNTRQFFNNVSNHLKQYEIDRIHEIKEMVNEAKKIFWYPFTQHAKDPEIKYFDSAYNDKITTYDIENNKQFDIVDGIGSWWTNGVGHGNINLSKAISYTNSRYGHVMFAESVSKPSLQLGQRLLNKSGPGHGWATRIFFTDNGSTGMEVSLKMAFKKRQINVPEKNHCKDIRIVGLVDSYHGDTLGVMDCSEESDFNESQTPWYKPRGIFLKPSTIYLRRGVWTVNKPDWLLTNKNDQTETVIMNCKSWRDMIKERREISNGDEENDEYMEIIGNKIDEILENNENMDLGALVIEPLLQGAGGMKLIDPKFQNCLIQVCRNRKIPIVFDEIFTGLWRLGEISAAKLLNVQPDIASYSKLLTGGTVPLAVTLTNEETFNSFHGESKKDALLHGHSYTAHAIGCAAAVQSLDMYQRSNNLIEGDVEWWDEGSARDISGLRCIERVVVIGTVLSIELKSDSDGYAATGAKDVVKQLSDANVFARPLGNVVYLMCTPLSDKSVCHELTKKLMTILQGIENESDRTSNERVSSTRCADF